MIIRTTLTCGLCKNERLENYNTDLPVMMPPELGGMVKMECVKEWCRGRIFTITKTEEIP